MAIKLEELFRNYGIGVMATANNAGSVNTAVYARPHVIDDTTLVWGMTNGRTFRNISENPQASFLFRESVPGFRGVRIALELLRTEDSGEMLDTIKKNTNEVVGPGAGSAVTHAAWFKINEIRALI
jgi:general stress protein 26